MCGRHACAARFARSPESIVRAYFTPQSLKDFAATARALASQKRAYHVVDSETIAKVSGTVHHEGVCFIVRREHPVPSVSQLLNDSGGNGGPLLVLDGVSNPHNLGAIARVAAHFGAAGLIIVSAGTLAASEPPSGEEGSREPAYGPSFFRTAQGGAEFLSCVHVASEQVPQTFAEMERAGYVLMGTSSHRGKAVYDIQLPPRVAFVLGSESHGLSDSVRRALKQEVSLPGTGNVESLNVACAASGLLLEHWRQNHARGRVRNAERLAPQRF
jgi:TrmH RNA methyltransferase